MKNLSLLDKIFFFFLLSGGALMLLSLGYDAFQTERGRALFILGAAMMMSSLYVFVNMVFGPKR